MSLSARLFATLYDSFLKSSEQAGLADRRADLLGGLTGRVLEIGSGTGLNLRHYSAQADLTLTEPETPMVKRLQRRAREVRPDAMVIRAGAEELPFDDDSFDAVVTTLTLCTVPDVDAVLTEVARVLRPGGELVFLEHVRSEDAKVARRQDRMNAFTRVVAHGCNCNRPTLDALARHGYRVTDLERAEFPEAPSFIRPLVVGRATA